QSGHQPSGMCPAVRPVGFVRQICRANAECSTTSGNGETMTAGPATAPLLDQPPYAGPVIDTDIHITLPSLTTLHPFLERRWRDYLIESGTKSLESNLYPAGAAISTAPQWQPPSGGRPGTDLDVLRSTLLDPWRITYGIVNCVYGVPMIHNDD